MARGETGEGPARWWSRRGVDRTGDAAGHHTAEALFVIAASAANAQAPWYNGDFNGFEYYVAGENIPTLGTYRNYENFVLTGSSYQISSIFANFVTLRPDLRWSSVYWAVLKDVGNASKGSLIASGTSAATQSFVGTVPGLSIWNSAVSLSLQLAPGAYWLAMSPIYDLPDNRSFSWNDVAFNAATAGLNGTNAVLDNRGFENERFATGNAIDHRNLSYGVIGEPTTVPDPATLVLVGTG